MASSIPDKTCRSNTCSSVGVQLAGTDRCDLASFQTQRAKVQSRKLARIAASRMTAGHEKEPTNTTEVKLPSQLTRPPCPIELPTDEFISKLKAGLGRLARGSCNRVASPGPPPHSQRLCHALGSLAHHPWHIPELVCQREMAANLSAESETNPLI